MQREEFRVVSHAHASREGRQQGRFSGGKVEENQTMLCRERTLATGIWLLGWPDCMLTTVGAGGPYRAADDRKNRGKFGAALVFSAMRVNPYLRIATDGNLPEYLRWETIDSTCKNESGGGPQEVVRSSKE